MVRLLVEDYKADVAAKDDDGETALDWAAAEGHEEVSDASYCEY